MVSSRTSLMLCALIGAIMVWNLHAYVGVNWELLATKHYFPGFFFYGGYTDTILARDDVIFTIQRESWPCLDYVVSSLTPHDAGYRQSQSIDRVFTCGFLPSLIVRLAHGHLHLETAIVVVNFLLWIASIALTFGIVRVWSANRTAALIGAVIAAGYPIYGLLFQSWKIQYGGAVLLLAWIYVDKAIWPRLGWTERGLLLTLTFTVTALAAGAAYFILVYIILWYLFLALFDASARREACLTIVLALFAFGAAMLANRAMTAHYHLTSNISFYHSDKIISDSLAFLWAALSGADTSSLRFMNYPGASFLTSVLPWYLALCFKANPVIIIVPLIGLFFLRELRPLILVVPPLFLVGHAPAIITGWTWYYGYSSAAAVHLLIVATAVCLGLLFDSRLAIGRPAAIVMLLAAVFFFNASPPFNFKNFYSGRSAYTVDRRLYVYHDEDVIRYW